MTRAGRPTRHPRRCRHGHLTDRCATVLAGPHAVFARTDTRRFDLLDVALVTQMLTVAGHGPLHLSDHGPVATLRADAEQVRALQDVAWDTCPQRMEAWMHALAPLLVADVVRLTGPQWTAEAEVSVELALALRADDVADLADRLSAGPVRVDTTRRAAQIVAADVPDPALVHFV